jgi:hypothetical protein
MVSSLSVILWREEWKRERERKGFLSLFLLGGHNPI